MSLNVALLMLANAYLAQPTTWDELRPTDSTLTHAVRAVVVTARVCRVGLGNMPDYAPGGNLCPVYDACAVGAGYSYLRCDGTPLMLIQDEETSRCRLAPLSFYFNRLAYARTFERLQGDWGVRGVFVGRWGAGPPGLTTLPAQRLAVRGTMFAFELPDGQLLASVLEARQWAGVTVLRPKYLAAEHRDVVNWFLGAYGVPWWQDYRVVVPLGGTRLVATLGQGVGFSAWYPRAVRPVWEPKDAK